MALADIGGILSTTITGAILLIVILWVLRCMWKRRKQHGSCCGCCDGCIQAACSSRKREEKNEDRN